MPRKKSVGAGIEFSYDTAEIELDGIRNHNTEKVQPRRLIVSLFAVF